MTRLLLKLQSKENTSYEMEYHYHLQGLIYRLIDKSKYDNHNKEGSKFFTFSNIFPYDYLKKGDIRNLMISSANPELIDFLQQQLMYDRDICVGNMQFKVMYCNKLKPVIPTSSFTLITGTPILMRINKNSCNEPEILDDEHSCLCWKTDYPISLFIKQLETNLTKRYNEYYNNESKPAETIFDKFKFKKQISTKLRVNYPSHATTIIATTWEFIFDSGCNGHTKLVQFALDAGLGELNSMGFGFMNIKQDLN